MKNKKERKTYISCTDKRIVIIFIISAILLVVTAFLLHKGGYAPGILGENKIASIIYWSVILLTCYISFLSTISTATIYLVGIIGNFYLNRKSIKNRKTLMGLPKDKEIKARLKTKADILQFFDEDAIRCTIKYLGNERIQCDVKIDFSFSTTKYDDVLDTFYIDPQDLHSC